MSTPASDLSARRPDAPRRLEPPEVPDGAVRKAEPWNFLIMSVYQIVMRLGWIFKTESIVIPAVLDTLGGAGWVRGFLPLLARFGQSVPPLLFSRRLKRMRHKKWAMAVCTLGMASMFFALASMFAAAGASGFRWMPAAFLVLYALFFVCTGLNQLAFGTLQGKLIRATLRGRLLMTANLIGAACAIAAAWCLLPLWLRPDGGDFHWMFAVTGICFSLSALSALFLREPADHVDAPPVSPGHQFAAAWHVLRTDRDLRRAAVVAMLFGTSIMLFPHYQALGRERLELPMTDLTKWVIVQNVGTALFSLIAGPLADWRGNRAVLRFSLLGIAAMPLGAIGLSLSGDAGRGWFWAVFVGIGLTPITIKTLYNYTLEIADTEDHPRYLSTLSLCVAVPLLFSPLVGAAVDRVGFEAVFIAVAAAVFSGWLLTWRLAEPRHKTADTVTPEPLAAEE